MGIFWTPAKASSEAGPSGHNARMTRSTSKEKNPKTTSSSRSKALYAPLPKSSPYAKKTVVIISGWSDVEEGDRKEAEDDAEGPRSDENTPVIIEEAGGAMLEWPPLEDDQGSDDNEEEEEEKYEEQDK